MSKDLSNWRGCSRPENVTLNGDMVVVETYDNMRHRHDLWNALNTEDANELMRFFPNDPFEGADDFGAWLAGQNEAGSYHTMVFRSVATNRVVGMASYLRIDAKNGSIEVGAVAHGAEMVRQPMATEAHYLMAKYIFDDLGYRRYEWKLNNENEPSHRAAKRFGFSFEGVFRQHIVAKGRNRDTAWYSIIDGEWPLIKMAFEAWLLPENFDENGMQKKRLEDIRAAITKGHGET